MLNDASNKRDSALRTKSQHKLNELNASLMYKSAAVIDLAFSSFKTFAVWFVLLVVIIMIDLLPALSKSTILTGFENQILRERQIAILKSEIARKTMEAMIERDGNLGEISSRLSAAKASANSLSRMLVN